MKKILLLLTMSVAVLLAGCNLEGQPETVNQNTQESKQGNVSTPSQTSSVDEEDVKLIPATVIRVIDGDTVKIDLNGKEEDVRILLIDTPETKHPKLGVQPFGPEASDFAKKFFKQGSEVGVEIDVSERDKYGRLLAYLWVNGKDYGTEVLKQGLARVAYIYPPNTKKVDMYREVQKIAQSQAIGIWSVENYATDKGFNEEAVEGGSEQKSKKEVVETPSSSSSTIPDANGDGKCNDIKGNEGSSGNIYHIPGGASYEVTKAEQYFCTEQEAEVAGFRKSQR